MSFPDPFAGALRTGQLLAGRVAVVSGAASARGIGRACAALMLAHGARVALLDLEEEASRRAAAELCPDPARAIGLRCNVASRSDCVAAIDRVLAWPGSGGRIDVLVNNAGLTQKRPVAEISEADFDRIDDVVLRGTLLLSQAVIPAMTRQGGGSLIAVSSMSAQQGGGVFGGAHYCAAKAGVLGLTRALARELGPAGIRANAVTPGLIVTDFSGSGRSDEEKDESGRGWPLGRAGRAIEVASACLFLASDLASYITGATLDVNGGAYMR